MRIVILGNSGSGKSTLARQLAAPSAVPVLDLDTIVWDLARIAVRRDDSAIFGDLDAFCRAGKSWIVEGCYADVAHAALEHGAELLFLDPGEEACLRNCRSRPWEPHKYPTPEEQDARLAFLLTWVSDYYRRDGEMSYAAHRALYEEYDGPKRIVTMSDV